MRRRLWEVAVPVPVRRAFVYEIPEDLGDPRPGGRVLAPFGGRRVTGYLLGEAAEEPGPDISVRRAVSLLDEEPSLPAELLGFLREAASYYLHPVGEVLRAALPPGMDPTERAGRIRGPRVRERLLSVARATPEAASVLEEMSRRAPARSAVLQRIVSEGEIPIPDLRSVHPAATRHVRRLADDGLVVVSERPRPPDPFAGPAPPPDDPPELTADQDRAVRAISTALSAGRYEGFLLHGVTGSGKTEVYLRVLARALESGRGGLVLVPEISLTPQLVRRYRARFGDALAVLHSGLTDRDRFDQWRQLRSGRVRVAVGVRSAAFAPVPDIGVLIVDEEHDGSFKQERGFPYQARDLALLRASRAGAVAVLGSATPSMETFRNATIGKLERLELGSRATSQPLPEVDIVDLRRHRSGPGGQRVISQPLCEAIRKTLDRGEQAILFLNRRGFAPVLVCPSCGAVQRCSDCAVSLTLHKRPAGLACHYCGRRVAVPDRCPACGGEDLAGVGAGTQRVEETIAGLFPEARIARLDRDVASGRTAPEVLDRLLSGEIDILVGTQMVTKGHDFPRVTLVGVLLADVGLHMPDFRAAERTFQLLTQVAGRAGRSALGGRAVVQTFCPEHPAVALARTHDFLSFVEAEMPAREELGYPPFGKLAAIRLSGPDGGRVEAAARDLFASIAEARRRRRARVDLLGPSPAPIPIVQGRHRWRLLLRAPRQDQIRGLLSEVIPFVESPPSGVRIRLDIDPVSML